MSVANKKHGNGIGWLILACVALSPVALWLLIEGAGLVAVLWHWSTK